MKTAETFMNTIPKGIAHEALVPPSVTEVLTKSFPVEFVIAGQEGFFLRNVLVTFPNIIPVIHLPNRAPMLIDMLKKLSEKIMVFDAQKGLVSITEITPDPEQAPPVHAVVEYNSGLSFTAQGKTVCTPRNNRFIFTYDETNSHCIIDKAFLA